MITAIIQARMGSSRLPKKTLEKIEGQPLLWHVIQRIKSCKNVDNIVIATTLEKKDDTLEEFCKKNSLLYYRGSTNNVLDRFYQAAKLTNPTIIVRVTADDPFKDPEVTDRIVNELLKDNTLDYASNTIRPTFPEGIDIEAFTFKALETAWKDAKTDYEKEHVTPHMWQNLNKFKTKNITHPQDLSKLRWTIDYPEDMDFAKQVYKRLYKGGEIFKMQDILQLLKQYPYLQEINANIAQRTSFKQPP